jgi:hypothetical protein
MSPKADILLRITLGSEGYCLRIASTNPEESLTKVLRELPPFLHPDAKIYGMILPSRFAPEGAE